MKHKNRVGRPRLKPDYDRTSEIEDLIFTAVSLFNIPYDDRQPRDDDAPSLNEVAEEMEITTVKTRKLLISGGVYSTELSRKVQEMEKAGMRIEEIVEKTRLKQSSVYSYLPYLKGAYKLPDPTLYAEQTRRFRARKKAVAELKDRHGYPNEMDCLWNCVIAFEGYRFVYGVEPFKYTVNESSILIHNKKIDRETIEKAYKAVLGGKLVSSELGCILKRFMQ
ncbi:hypothetical protein [Ruminococcus flavefaciens]|uniref:hypothetical protein n=1 Tax=Ruminococcus flavefaciens TaxID=1265 RepID=UPI0026ECFB31|nr:hypothetical protein [Ruminococcus flavefaciens]